LSHTAEQLALERRQLELLADGARARLMHTVAALDARRRKRRLRGQAVARALLGVVVIATLCVVVIRLR